MKYHLDTLVMKYQYFGNGGMSCQIRLNGTLRVIGSTTAAVPLRVPARSVRPRTTIFASMFFSGTSEMVITERSSSTISVLPRWGVLTETFGITMGEAVLA
jgi:hypothetical protein